MGLTKVVPALFEGSTGGGALNFLTNPDADNGTVGWTVDSFAAASRPAGALTGVATGVTFTASSTVPLAGSNSFILDKDAVSRQGRVVYTGITITPAYFAKVLQITADYLVNSGTFVAGSSTADSDVIFYLQNISDGTFIEPSSFKLLSNSTTIADRFSATFQTAAAATSYRLLLFVATNSASSYSLKFDNISVSPSVYVYGTPVTDWQSYTPTGSWTTNTTYTGKYRRVGDSIEVDTTATLAGAPNSATFSVNLPSGFTIDTTKLNNIDNIALGYGISLDAGVNSFSLIANYNTTTSVKATTTNASGTFSTNADVTQAVPFTYGASDRVQISFRVPILGLSSSVQMSDQTDTRVVSLNASVATGTLSGAFNVIKFTTIGKDTNGSYSAATGLWTCIVPGDYLISSSVEIVGTGVANATEGIRIKKGAGAVAANILTIATVNTAMAYSASAGVTLVAGDAVSVESITNRISPSFPVTNTNSNFSVSRISGPSAIAASESVNAGYITLSSTTLTSGTALRFTSKQFDSHGSYNTATGEYVPNIGGKFRVTMGTSYITAGVLNLDIKVAGVVRLTSFHQLQTFRTSGSATVDCLSGQAITIVPSASATAGATDGLFNIEKVGN